MSLNIRIQTIHHCQHRYDTVGDYYFDPEHNEIVIKISDMNNWKYEVAVALHELVEQTLCFARGIKEQDITEFDMKYERFRSPGDRVSEPGDSREAPYHKEHTIATAIERLFIEALGVDWADYEETISNLSFGNSPDSPDNG